MDDADARALVNRWWSIWRDGDLSPIDQICADPYLRHTGMGSERLTRAAYKERLRLTLRVLHGAATTIDDQVVVADPATGETKVWTRATSRGVNLTNEGDAVITWIVIHRIADGLIAKTWAATLSGVQWRAL